MAQFRRDDALHFFSLNTSCDRSTPPHTHDLTCPSVRLSARRCCVLYCCCVHWTTQVQAVLQEYVASPFLYEPGGVKFHLRLYLLVTSYAPMRCENTKKRLFCAAVLN
jgi:hypothetical protein